MVLKSLLNVMANLPLHCAHRPRQTDFRCGVCAGNDVMYSAAEGKAWKEECGVRKRFRSVMRARRWWLSAVPMQMGAERVSATAWRTSDHVHRLLLKFCLVAEGQAQLYPRFGPRIFGTPPLDMLWPQLPERTFRLAG